MVPNVKTNLATELLFALTFAFAAFGVFCFVMLILTGAPQAFGAFIVCIVCMIASGHATNRAGDRFEADKKRFAQPEDFIYKN